MAAMALTLAAAGASEGAIGPAGPARPAGDTVPGALNAVSCTGPASCMAAGSYVSSGATVTLAESWNGTRWTVRPTPDPAGGGVPAVYGLGCGAAGACLATGSYYLGSNVTPLAEWWDGTQWAIESVPLPAGAVGGALDAASCSSATACEAVGTYTTSGDQSMALAESWDGSTFTIMPVPVPANATTSTLTAVSCASAAVGCEAVGWVEMPSAAGARALTEGWNGIAWSVQATPRARGASQSTFPGGVSCASGGACTSAGLGVTDAGDDRGWAQAWNGTSWANQTVPQPPGAPDSILSGVSCTLAGSACAAVGYSSADGSVFTNYAEGWNGVRWTVQRLPAPAGTQTGDMTGVSCSSADACTGVGEVTNGSGVVVTLAERWDGRNWSVQRTPAP